MGFRQLSAYVEHERLTQDFEKAYHPTNCKRGTIGYKSITLNLPREVSLFVGGHREGAKGAIYAAVQSALDRAFAGLRSLAVAAIHTRNQAKEIHYHVRVLARSSPRTSTPAAPFLSTR